MRTSLHLSTLILGACFLRPAVMLGQELPFLTESQYRYLVGEISGDASYEHIRFHTQFHKPRGGTPGLMKVAEYFEAKAKDYGLEGVKLIRQKSNDTPWHANAASLWLIEPEVRLLADIEQTPIRLADNSRMADVQAELVDVGAGLAESDYAGKDVAGRIVLAHGNAGQVMAEAVWKRQALGVIYFPNPSAVGYPLNSLTYPDQIRWITLPAESSDHKAPTFAFVLSTRQGVLLRNQLAGSSKPLKVHAKVDAEYGGEPWQVMVEAFIRGTEINDQDVVLTGHLQEEKYSANDDGSGCANTLEIARALSKLIREGRLPRPRRNLRFWWVTEISSQRQYFADNPAEAQKILLNINQDMVGANQAQDVLRVQNITRVPFSRSHYLTALAERVIRFVVESNTEQLSIPPPEGRGGPPKPIYSTLGTRHRYNAAMIPFHNSTDHMTFNEAPIGVPGITFTNWPDNFIHTSDDDLWNIDRTQLQRNAFAAATMAFVAASASDSSIPELATETYNAALTHLTVDATVANNLIRSSDEAGLSSAYRIARNQIRQGILRERRALLSVAGAGSKAGPGVALVGGLLDSLVRLETSLQSDLDRFVLALKGRTVMLPAPGEKEREMATRIPRLVAGPTEFLEARSKIGGVSGFHNLMAFEATNFVDGQRSALGIYEAVLAEALHAGTYYYGKVTVEMVDQHLKNLEQAGVIKY
jgi:hypothetical protein